MRVLLIGHACAPDAGSEPGFTWNWAWHLSAHHEVWVLAHDQWDEKIEKYLVEHPNPNLHFHFVTLPSRSDPWKPARGDRGLRLHYVLWQNAAFRAATQLHASLDFDVAHHVSWGTVSAPPKLWRLPIPFVWGPLGGGQTAPAAFRDFFGRAWPKEAARNFRVRLAPSLPPVRRAARRSELVLATNRETAQILRQARANNLQLFLDSGLPPNYLPSQPLTRSDGKPFTLLWAGRLEHRKALPLALEALARAEGPPTELLVAGDGPQREEWMQRVHALRLEERVRFLGVVPWGGMPELFRQADAFIFTSLRDAFGSVVLEAMAHALPVITLDHQGVGTFVPPEAAIKVAVTTPREVIRALAVAISRLAAEPGLREQMGKKSWSFATNQTWDVRVNEITRWYEQVRKA